jgi:hypothetical protein
LYRIEADLVTAFTDVFKTYKFNKFNFCGSKKLIYYLSGICLSGSGKIFSSLEADTNEFDRKFEKIYDEKKLPRF